MNRDITRKEFLEISGGSVAALALGAASAQGQAGGTNPIIIENAKPGSSDWEPTNQSQNREIEGYADKTSLKAGEQIKFFVNTASASYKIDIYRLGWYGGAGARLHRTVSRTGVRQVIPTPNPTTGLIECKWKSPYTLTLPTGTLAWTSGIYLAKLTTREGKQSHIPFVVRDDTRFVNHLVQASVNTWQAYNNWGGKSLYDYNSTGGRRASKVSFNRPYSAYGSGDFYNDWSGWELNTLRFLEREGYDISYCTNIDTHANPILFARCRSFISCGHDEYWSYELRNNVEWERNQGHHVAFLGANAAYWQVRFEPGFNGVPYRTMVCYKDAAQDPYYQNPATRELTTIRWRDLEADRPEGEFIGVQFYYYPVNADMVVKNTNHWVFAGTGLQDNDRLPGLVGYEADSIMERTPLNATILADSPVDTGVEQGFSNMIAWQHSGGAWVFATGSMQFAWGLDSHFAGWSHPNLVHPAAQQILRNVLARFSI